MPLRWQFQFFVYHAHIVYCILYITRAQKVFICFHSAYKNSIILNFKNSVKFFKNVTAVNNLISFQLFQIKNNLVKSLWLQLQSAFRFSLIRNKFHTYVHDLNTVEIINKLINYFSMWYVQSKMKLADRILSRNCTDIKWK